MERVLRIDGPTVDERVRTLAGEIDLARIDDPVAVVVMTGAMWFAAELLRWGVCPGGVFPVFVSTYSGTERTQEPHVVVKETVYGRNVIIVEDIIDTGHTVTAVTKTMWAQGAESVHVATLLDKPSRRIKPFDPDWVGFTIEDYFAVGYGLDYDHRDRELYGIYELVEDG